MNHTSISPHQPIGILTKQGNRKAFELAEILSKNLRALSRDSWIDQEENSSASALVVIGGDGTFLSAARRALVNNIPILGINMGSLGFLTEWQVTQVQEIAQLLSEPNVLTESRIPLECRIQTGTASDKPARSLCLNDVVISKAGIARLIDLDVLCNNKLIARYKCDGVIISTSLGSTAYNLAAGGPIIHPECPVLVLTPICAHSLTSRPLVLPISAALTIQLKDSANQTVTTLDGQLAYNTSAGDVVSIGIPTTERLEVIRPPTADYFQLIRKKLNFGERN